MGDSLPEHADTWTDEHHMRMGQHALDKFKVEGAIDPVWEELNRQYENGDEHYDLTEWRDTVGFSNDVLEEAIHFLIHVERMPIRQGPTAFVGWFEDAEE